MAKKTTPVPSEARPAMISLVLANEGTPFFINPKAIALITHEFSGDRPRPGRCIVTLHSGAAFFAKGDPAAIARLCGPVRGM